MASLGIFRDVLVVLIVGLAIGAYAAYTRDLPQPTMPEMSAHADLAPIGKRHVEHVTLHTDHIGDIGLAISMPDPPPPKPMPIVVVLGGLGTGEDNIRNIPDAGDNVIVGYDWPMTVEPPDSLSFLLQTPRFYNSVMNVPAQIASAINWLTTQTWTDPGRISILGYSMGALAAPAAEDLTQQTDHIVQWTILAYGGAPLASVLAADPYIQPAWMRWLLTPFAALLLHPLEPTEHLPNLSGHFLVIEGKNDDLVPESARATLREAVPEPKSVIVLEGGHMGTGPDEAALLQQIIGTSRDWLAREGAVNPL